MAQEKDNLEKLQIDDFSKRLQAVEAAMSKPAMLEEAIMQNLSQQTELTQIASQRTLEEYTLLFIANLERPGLFPNDNDNHIAKAVREAGERLLKPKPDRR